VQDTEHGLAAQAAEMPAILHQGGIRTRLATMETAADVPGNACGLRLSCCFLIRHFLSVLNKKYQPEEAAD
jgi:hypothetical protein